MLREKLIKNSFLNLKKCANKNKFPDISVKENDDLLLIHYNKFEPGVSNITLNLENTCKSVKLTPASCTDYLPSVPVWGLRLLPALLGSMVAPLSYQLMAELHFSRWTAALSAALIILGEIKCEFLKDFTHWQLLT